MRTDTWYDIAQVCKNGHVNNAFFKSNPTPDDKYCPECGMETITTCLSCNTPIRGYYHSGVAYLGKFIPPSYCFSCGKAFPWVEEKINAIKELSEEIEELSTEDRNIINNNIKDITINSPKTEIASIKIKKILNNLKDASGGLLKKLIAEVAVEAAKKAIFN